MPPTTAAPVITTAVPGTTTTLAPRDVTPGVNSSGCPNITSWQLYNVGVLKSDVIRNVTNGDVVCLNNTNPKLNLEVRFDKPVDAVYFLVNRSVVHMERSSGPYFIGGQLLGKPLNWSYMLGEQNISVIAEYQGHNCSEHNLMFDLIENCNSTAPHDVTPGMNATECPKNSSWVLYDSVNDTAIHNITDGALICLNETGRNLNLRVIPWSSVDRVFFFVNGTDRLAESKAPYFIGGHQESDVLNWTYSLGSQNISVMYEVGGRNCTETVPIMIDIMENCRSNFTGNSTSPQPAPSRKLFRWW